MPKWRKMWTFYFTRNVWVRMSFTFWWHYLSEYVIYLSFHSFVIRKDEMLRCRIKFISLLQVALWIGVLQLVSLQTFCRLSTGVSMTLITWSFTMEREWVMERLIWYSLMCYILLVSGVKIVKQYCTKANVAHPVFGWFYWPIVRPCHDFRRSGTYYTNTY